jgi:hypothetical protein
MLILAATFAAVPLLPSESQEPDPVTWSAHAPPFAAPGSTTSIAVAATIVSGWHMYSLTQPEGGPSALTFSVADASVASIGKAVRGPKPRIDKQPAFDVPVELYDNGTSAFVVPIVLNADIPDGKRSLVIRATWQACSRSVCLLPRSQDIPVEIVVRHKR